MHLERTSSNFLFEKDLSFFLQIREKNSNGRASLCHFPPSPVPLFHLYSVLTPSLSLDRHTAPRSAPRKRPLIPHHDAHFPPLPSSRRHARTNKHTEQSSRAPLLSGAVAMAHDGFPGSFNGLAWPYAPLDALQVQHALMGAGVGVGWEHEASARALDSALSSLVSSSPSSLDGGGRGAEGAAALMDELASRLGGRGLGVSLSPPQSSSRYASCYSTPVSSPSKPAPPPVPPLVVADSALAERAARLSCLLPAAGGPSGGMLSRVASSQSLLPEPAAVAAAAAAQGGAHLPASGGSSSDGHCRKRKAPGAKAKGKDAVTAAITKSPESHTRAKKCKQFSDASQDDEPITPAAGESGHDGNGKGKDEPLKDYIHVRARRGQATDSHSLAERVRREKISERMKLLQDLVPSCNKVTGKAVMLDEIINYVQSLQRQVEFLSMKLATVNPRLDFDVDNFLPKDASQPSAPAPASLPPPPSAYSLEGSSPAFCYASSQGTAMQSVVTNAKGFDMPSSFVNHGMPSPSVDEFQNANTQIGSLWEDDLQSVVQMGFRGNT